MVKGNHIVLPEPSVSNVSLLSRRIVSRQPRGNKTSSLTVREYVHDVAKVSEVAPLSSFSSHAPIRMFNTASQAARRDRCAVEAEHNAVDRHAWTFTGTTCWCPVSRRYKERVLCGCLPRYCSLAHLSQPASQWVLNSGAYWSCWLVRLPRYCYSLILLSQDQSTEISSSSHGTRSRSSEWCCYSWCISVICTAGMGESSVLPTAVVWHAKQDKGSGEKNIKAFEIHPHAFVDWEIQIRLRNTDGIKDRSVLQ